MLPQMAQGGGRLLCSVAGLETTRQSSNTLHASMETAVAEYLLTLLQLRSLSFPGHTTSLPLDSEFVFRWSTSSLCLVHSSSDSAGTDSGVLSIVVFIQGQCSVESMKNEASQLSAHIYFLHLINPDVQSHLFHIYS